MIIGRRRRAAHDLPRVVGKWKDTAACCKDVFFQRRQRASGDGDLACESSGQSDSEMEMDYLLTKLKRRHSKRPPPPNRAQRSQRSKFLTRSSRAQSVSVNALENEGCRPSTISKTKRRSFYGSNQHRSLSVTTPTRPSCGGDTRRISGGTTPMTTSAPRATGGTLPRTAGGVILRATDETTPMRTSATGVTVPRTIGGMTPRAIGETTPRAIGETTPRAIGETTPIGISGPAPRVSSGATPYRASGGTISSELISAPNETAPMGTQMTTSENPPTDGPISSDAMNSSSLPVPPDVEQSTQFENNDDTGFSSDHYLVAESEISKALKDMTSVLNTLVQRVDSNANEIRTLKLALQKNSTSC